MCFYIKKNQHPFVESLIRSIVLFKYNFPVTFMRNSLKKHSSDRNLLIPWNSPLLIARQPRNGDDKTGDWWDSHQNCWSKIKQTLTQKTDCPVLSPSILVTIIRVCVCVSTVRKCVRDTIVEKFAGPYDRGEFSPSVQKTLYESQLLILERVPEVGWSFKENTFYSRTQSFNNTFYSQNDFYF